MLTVKIAMKEAQKILIIRKILKILLSEVQKLRKFSLFAENCA